MQLPGPLGAGVPILRTVARAGFRLKSFGDAVAIHPGHGVGAGSHAFLCQVHAQCLFSREAIQQAGEEWNYAAGFPRSGRFLAGRDGARQHGHAVQISVELVRGGLHLFQRLRIALLFQRLTGLRVAEPNGDH